MTAAPDAARPEALPLHEFDGILRRTGEIALTIEDIVLLILHADPRPVKGLSRLAGEVLLALKEVLTGPDVEPAVFEGGPGGPRSADVERALDSLAFSNSVRVSGGGNGDAGAMQFEIAPRGRARIKKKWNALPARTRHTLEQKRAEWDAAAEPASLEGAYIHNAALLEGASRAAPASGRDGRRTTERPPASDAGPGAAGLQEHTDRGDRFYAAGRYDEAYAAYRTAARSDAPDADLHFRMAMSLHELGLHDKALRHCRAAIKADPAHAGGYIAMGHCLHRLGRYAEALRYTRRAVLRDPSSPGARSLHGVVLDRLGRHDRALRHHAKAARLDPRSAQAHQNASFSLFHLNRYKEALWHAKRAAKISPKDPLAHARISLCLSGMGLHKKAIPPGRKAVKAAPDRVDSYMPLMIPLRRLGRHEEVLRLCGRAIAADQADPRPYYTMALSLRALGRQKEALTHCLRAVGINPREADFHTLASYLLRDLGRFAEALSHCRAAVSARPDDPRALSNTGGILAELGRHEEALGYLDRAIRIDPRRAVPRYNRALSLQETNRLDEALEEYRRAAELDPRNTGAHNNAGIVLAELGRDGEAVEHFGKAIGLDPGNFGLHCNKALSLQRLGRHREALAHFDRAIELNPGNADAYVERLSCLSELGLPDEAIGHYAAESLGPAAPPSRGAVPAAAGRRAAEAAPATRVDASPAAGRAQLVKSLLSKDESEVLEFKSWPGSHQEGSSSKQGRMEEKIARELCGLVNTRGGDLLIGVDDDDDDDGKAEGLAPGGRRLSHKQRDELLDWISNVIASYIGTEHGGRFDCGIVDVDGLDILHCRVDASQDEPVILRKRLEGKHDFFTRVGNTCRPLGSMEMLKYVKKRWPERAPRPQPTGRSEANQESGLPDVLENGGGAFSTRGQ